MTIPASDTVADASASTRRHRWPAGRSLLDKAREPGHGENDAAQHYVERFQAAVGDMTKFLRLLEPAVCLDTRTVQLDANGQATAQFRVPFRAVHVTSQSAAALTITASPPAASAPANGPGVAMVHAGGQETFNIGGYAWSIYGGTAGEQVTVQTFSRNLNPGGGR